MSKLILTLTAKDVERFWSKVNKNGPTPPHCPELGPCWVWRYGCLPAGYGNFTVSRTGKVYRLLAHWVSFYLAHDRWAFPFCLHRCDNPSCCNPGHLWEGTPRDNSRDMVTKKRHGAAMHPESICRGDRAGLHLHPERAARGDSNGSRLHPERLKRGEDNARSKLSNCDIISICTLRRSGVAYRDIGTRFGVSASAIVFIWKGKTWKHVDAGPRGYLRRM